MKFCISTVASDYIKQKGGEIIIFKGNLMSCCGGTMPNPMLEVGHPRRPLENYRILEEMGVTIYLDNDLLPYQGIAEIGLMKNLFWKSISFNYREE
ncbi:MAG: CC/Se motif family (seleno)protein [Desulfitobacterium hafniense]|nr:CC/Se motif family (seleno)protein [Desulfitobacterium hafniense]